LRHFGLIGNPLGHSFSPGYFKRKFEGEFIIDASYQALEIEDLKSLPDLIADREWRGFNVTIPYKKSVMTFLSELSHEARVIGAVNCVHVKGDYWTGYNTDALAFETSLLRMLNGIRPKQTLVLGTGGSAAAVNYTLAKLNLPFKSVSRTDRGDLNYSDISPSLLRACELVVNCTPLGMHPNTEACPDLPYEAVTDKHFFFDLVYNPEETLFLRRGTILGATTQNGLEMLHLQAEKSWEIWNSSNENSNLLSTD